MEKVVVGAATATTAVTALTASGLLLLIGKDIGKVANRALEKGKEDIPKENGETGKGNNKKFIPKTGQWKATGKKRNQWLKENN